MARIVPNHLCRVNKAAHRFLVDVTDDSERRRT